MNPLIQLSTASNPLLVKKTFLQTMLAVAISVLAPIVAHADSATWDLNPGSGDWNTAGNWTPMTIPNGPADIATFGLSNTTDVSISENTEVNGIIFTSAATNPYTITASPNLVLTLSGTGVINNSGATQNFVTAVDALGSSGAIVFTNSASAGSSTLFTNNSSISDGGSAGSTFFTDNSSAASGTFTNNGGASFGSNGGFTFFTDNSSAGTGTFINNGANGDTSGPGFTFFRRTSTAGSATLIANPGTNGGPGGGITFIEDATGGTSRVEVFGNGGLDISFHNAPGVTIGSIEGDGNVFLGANTLTVGSNNLSTTFSGVMQGVFGGTGGSLTKIGPGTLILSGANTYTGGTNVNRGVLQVDGSTTSNTFVNHGGTLAGTGTINGNVVDNGRVSPGSAGAPGMLTVTGNYTQAQYATLMIQIAGASPDQFSVLNVLGTANLNGSLDPVLLNGFVPSIGDSFIFLNYASRTGEFSRILHRVFNNGTEQWSVIYEDNHAILTVAAFVPDQGSTFLLLTLALLGLVTYRHSLLRKQAWTLCRGRDN